MTIALTGASGHLGRLVVEEILASGFPAEQLVAIVRNPAKVADLADRGVQVRQADYRDHDAWRPALEGVDRLLLISVSGNGASAAHRPVIEAAAKTGVKHLAYTSILNADHTSNPLAPEHYATERLIAASGVPATILRDAWYHELYTRLLPEYFATGEVVGSTGNGRISGAARADFAAAAAAVLLAESPEPSVLELGGPSFTLTDFAATLSDVSGRPISYRNLTADEHTAELERAGQDAGSAGFVVGVDQSIAKGEMYTDSTALADLIGRNPITLAESIRRAL